MAEDTEAVVDGVKAEAVVVDAAKVGREAPAGQVVVPVDLAAASASISARRKFASSASRRWTSSTTNARTFFRSLFRNAERFFRGA